MLAGVYHSGTLWAVKRVAGRMAGELMACKICGAPISSDRLEAQPRSVTCSTKCSQERKAILRKAGAARHRGRQKKNQEEGN